MKRILLFVIGGLLLLVLAERWWWSTVNQPLQLTANTAIIVVSPGDSLRSVLEEAAQRGWLHFPGAVARWAQLYELDTKLHVGEYQVERGDTATDFLEQLNNGDSIRYQVTLPEGITLARALEILAEQQPLRSSLKGPEDPRLLAVVAPHDSAEGWFMPDTYIYQRGDSDLSILKRAHRAMAQELEQQWITRAGDTPLETLYDALILASIVERETAVAEERGQIAGVFSRRLQQGIRLQTDPTVIYGLGDQYSGNLTRTHLRDGENRWNTYRHNGLPPSPIALPGRAAIMAALHPEAGDALYFVARGDGYHSFASTLEEHNANVRQYQLNLRSDYRSTPKEEGH